MRSLPAELRTFYARLGVFAGGFRATEAAEVCETESLAAAENWLATLTTKFLVTTDGARYALPEWTRASARARLPEAERERLAGRHLTCFLRLVEQEAARIEAAGLPDAGERFREEAENFEAALTWGLVEENDISLALRLLSILNYFWKGREW